MSYYGSNPPYYISAYGMARKMGFEGTVEEWLDSLTAFYMAKKAGFAGTSEEWVKKLVDPLPDITIGQVVTLEGGSMATVEITGTKEKPVLNFGIPRGVGMADALPLVGGKMKGMIDMDGNGITNVPDPTNDKDTVPKSYADKIEEKLSKALKEECKKLLSLSGGTMTGDVNMNGKRLYNIKTPTEDKEAAPKNYVDTAEKNAKTYAETKTVNATLTAAGWSESVPYTQTIEVTGLSDSVKAETYPMISGDLAVKQALAEEAAKINYCTRSSNQMTFECWDEKPEADISIIVEVYV